MKGLWVLAGAAFLIGGVARADESTLQLSRPKTGTMSLDFKDTNVTAILKSIADTGGFKVRFFGRSIEKKVSLLLMENVSPEEAFVRVCKYAGLNYLRFANTSTFLVASADSGIIPSQTPQPQAPAPQPRDPFNPFRYDDPMLQPNPHWRKFDFNDAPYYVVPLPLK